VGSEYTIINIPAGQYDVLVEDCDHNVMAWNFAADLVADSTLTISTAPNVVIIENHGSTPLCGVYISAANSDRWGRGHLNDSHPIEPAESRSFALQPGLWDLRVVSCEGEEVIRYGEEIHGTMTWTITD
jgi:hypothetical protein